MMVRLPSFSKMNFPSLKRLADFVGLVLVSGSPRRRRILTEAGIPFDLVVPTIEETIQPDLSPDRQAVALARQKVESVPMDGKRFYLGCDTIVVLDGRILTKPVDEADALLMLTMLSGRVHSVFSALVLFDSRAGAAFEAVEESRVRFNHLDHRQLLDYIATGEPLDKAGAYGIQGMGGFLVDSVEGNIDTVVGLPMGALERLAAQAWDGHAR
jgi:septum formation protein